VSGLRLERALESLSAGRGRILVSRLQYLGDVVLSLPLVAALRREFPRCEIDYLTRPAGAELLAGDPIVDELFCAPVSGGGPAATLRLMRRLRRRDYRLAIDLYSNPRSALLVRASGATVRIGGTRRIRRHLFTHAVTVPKAVRSAIEHHLYFLKCLGLESQAGKPVLTLSPEETASAREWFERPGGNLRGPRIGLHPGGKWTVKRWPLEFFAALARRLIQQLGAAVYVFQGPGEDEIYSQRLKAQLGDKAIYLPALPIRQAAAVMQALDAGVFCDGGAMHVSVAVGTPTVGIFGSSEPDIWFPYESFGPYRPAFVPQDCRPCHQHDCDHLSCLTGLDAGAVEQVVQGVLKQARTDTAEGSARHGSNE